MKFLTVIWLLILSDGVAAMIGARSAWDMRDEAGRRLELAVALSFGLFCYAAARFGAVVNGIYHAAGVTYPDRYLHWAIGLAGLQSIGVWVIALTLLNGRSPGFVKRMLSRMLNLAR